MLLRCGKLEGLWDFGSGGLCGVMDGRARPMGLETADTVQNRQRARHEVSAGKQALARMQDPDPTSKIKTLRVLMAL